MISLKDNRTALFNIDSTIEALEKLDILIEHFSVDIPGPAYLTIQHVHLTNNSIQIDRKIFLPVLTQQRQNLVEYLATLGIDANN